LVEKRHCCRSATCCATALAASITLGCVREPTEEICPAVGPGDLIVTEIRGAQSTPDTYGQWIEIFNTTATSFDLRGLQLRMVRLSGGNEVIAILREDELPIDPQQYFVIGHHDPARLPSFVDATIFPDFYGKSSTTGLTQPRSLYADAAIELIACGAEIDRMFYRDLPKEGTLALDGALKPTSDASSDPDAWCNDQTEAPIDGPQTDLGIPGTPGEANPPCP
jgi:hypothetical protein